MLKIGALAGAVCCMLVLAFFLSFLALWVGDGYYPVGWSWKGSLLHLALWCMPFNVVVGSLMAAFRTHKWTATVLLVSGVGPLILFVIWIELESTLSKLQPDQNVWPYLRLLGAGLTLIALAILLRHASGEDVA
jgi:hypothetical protein